ncbi:MAG: type I restriction-modification system methyltransferase, partial [Prolixibacteraceae bacterium]
EGLATYVSILSFNKQLNEVLNYAQIVNNEISLDNIIWYKFNFDNFSDDAWDFNLNQSIKNKIYQYSVLLGDCADFVYGIISGYDAAFIVSHEEAKKHNLEEEMLFEFVKPENYSRYGLEKLDKFIIYPYDNDNNLYSEDLLKTQFPNTYNYLYQNKEILENRKDSRFTILEKGLNWYVIMRRIDSREIAKSKIVFYDVGMLPNFYLDINGVAFGGGTSHSLSVKNINDFHLEYLLALLNSKLIGWIIQDICPVKMGGARKYGLDYMRRLPIRKIAIDNQKQYLVLSQIITDSISKLNSIKIQFSTLLRSKYELEKISKNLQNWFDLEFKDFLKELQKANVKLTLSEEADWMNYFTEQKQKAQTLKSEIDKTDREIDRMVYALYGLTEEEIKIVEESV